LTPIVTARANACKFARLVLELEKNSVGLKTANVIQIKQSCFSRD